MVLMSHREPLLAKIAFFRTAGDWERDHDFKPVKVKKEKKHNDRDDDDRGDGRRGKGNMHDG